MQTPGCAPATVVPVRCFAIALLAALAFTATASAMTFGDVDVTVENEPRETANHGYAEVWIRVANRSSTEAHDVRLTLPQNSYSYGGKDYLRAITRSVTVEPGKVARVALSYPEKHPIDGSGLGVAIDGRDQEASVSLSLPSHSSHRYSSSYGSSSSSLTPLVLGSRSASSRFLDAMQSSGYSSTPTVRVFRAEQPVAAWSPNWLGYSRYDGVVVTAEDFRMMPAEVRTALEQYTECGGSLLLLGEGGTLPASWKPLAPEQDGLTSYAAGFGVCQVSTGSEPSRAKSAAILSAWNQTLNPWRKERQPGEANREFPVVEDLQVPVQGMLFLMVIFVLVIGPLNLYLLSRWKRKLWLFLTVPLLSLATCLSVFGYMLLSEGWSGKSRIEGVTILDQNTRRASSLGWEAFYTPVLPGDGLHFSPETEVSYQNGDDPYSYRRRSSASALSIEWGGDQRLSSGFLTPRVPSHFLVRKGEPRRERITFAVGQGFKAEAVNGLGADLIELWYMDAAGKLYHTTNVPAGGRVLLEPAEVPARAGKPRSLRELYTADWTNLTDRTIFDGPAMLKPRTYMAVMEASPFLDDAMNRASKKKAKSIVFGILKEGGDES